MQNLKSKHTQSAVALLVGNERRSLLLPKSNGLKIRVSAVQFCPAPQKSANVKLLALFVCIFDQIVDKAILPFNLR